VGALVDGAPSVTHWVVGLPDDDGVVRVDRALPLLGVEVARAMTIDGVEVVRDLIGTHLVQRADVDEEVGIQRSEKVKLVWGQERELGLSQLRDDLVRILE